VGLVAATMHGSVARLRLNRPGKRNALNHELVAQALVAIDEFGRSGATIGVLEAAGSVFCAGNDVTEAQDDPAESASAELERVLLSAPLFWVAVLSGAALGSGLGIACCCPVVIASETAWLALPEVQRIDAYPSVLQSYLETVLRPRAALDLCLTGRSISATEAATLGIVTEAVPAASLPDRVDDWIARLAALEPRVVTAAREAWQSRFNGSFATRSAELDEIFRGQLPL
jgi:methylglutaconyl-CoA hydratase